MNTGTAARLDVRIPGRGGVVLLVHGRGSRRSSSQIHTVADTLRQVGFSAVAVDLPTHEEPSEVVAQAGRVAAVVDWLTDQPTLAGRPIGLFGVNAAGAAALVAAVERPAVIRAIVSLGVGPDLASDALPWVSAPTLLIAGDRDESVVELNRHAMESLGGTKRLEVVSEVSRHFDCVNHQVAELAANWFLRHLGSAPQRRLRTA